MRHLDENARAVSRVDLAAACAAVVEVAEDLKSLLDEVVGFLPLDVGYKSDSAGIVFVPWVVQSLFLRWSLVLHFVVVFAYKKRPAFIVVLFDATIKKVASNRGSRLREIRTTFSKGAGLYHPPGSGNSVFVVIFASGKTVVARALT
jgi:hypothetical protein